MLTACGIMHPRCCRRAAWMRSAPEDGRNHRPKRVELIGINNKMFLLHLVWLSILFASVMHGQANIKCLSNALFP